MKRRVMGQIRALGRTCGRHGPSRSGPRITESARIVECPGQTAGHWWGERSDRMQAVRDPLMLRCHLLGLSAWVAHTNCLTTPSPRSITTTIVAFSRQFR